MKRLLTLAVMFLCCMATSFAQFSGSGSGTENDPYLILNPIQLNQMRNFLNQSGVHFKLMANIDLTEFLEDENPSQGWQPVGTSSTPFKGVLDGNGKTISGLWINRENTDYVGLFGNLSGGSVKNLTLYDATVCGGNYVGLISGSNAIVTDCKISGIVNGKSYVGGGVGSSGNFTRVISSVMVHASGNNVGGIIGSSGELHNCVVNANVEGNDYVGGLIGDCYGSSITECGFIGCIIGNSNIGGLAGRTSCSIEKCYVLSDITAKGDNIGGLVGYYQNGNYGCKCQSSYYCGNISGNSKVGGLVGYLINVLYKCYSKANVTGHEYVGGIAGYMGDGYMCWSVVNSCTAINNMISASDNYIGRIYGDIRGDSKALSNQSINRTIVVKAGVAQDIIDDEQNGTSVGATTLKLKATYVAMGWDFTDTWDIQETECYPYMKSQTAPPVIQSQVVSGATTVSGKCVDGGTITLEIDGVKQQMVSTGQEFSFTVSPLQAGHEVRVSAKTDGKEQSYYATEVVSFLGKGTETDPYQISTAADLTQVYRKGYYKLMNDIDLTDYINQFSPTEGWLSIGRDGSETIHFDGDGHKITGLWCNSTRDNTGLFSCFANGTIKNLTVKTAPNKQVKGGANTGIIIGKMINGTIENCSVEGSVADGTPVGGLVGLFDGGSISKCRANVTINTTLDTSYIGGLVGEITGGTIDQCFTEGNLTGTGNESYIGGLIGKNQGTLTNSYSIAVINSSYNAAGVVAYNYGLVDKCYATGNLHSNNYAAGVIGYNDGANAVVINCAAMNNILDVVYESQQQQQGGGYGQRIIGGIKNGAPAPEMNNYALKTMQVSLNDVPQKVYDDIMNGTAKTADELRNQTTYTAQGWDFSNIWSINDGYPYLKMEESADVEMFTLTYKVDGEVYKQYELAVGDAITPEAAPTKEGYTFSGWSEIPATMPANDVTIIGTFAQNPTETEYAFVDVSALGIDDQELHMISAGTTLCESSSVSMSNAYDDSFSAVSMAISGEQNYQVNINGKKYIYGEGVRGATNAKPYSIGECQEDGTFVGGQYEGWVYKFTTLYDGYLYVPCRIATNKSIYVWAGNADEAAGRLVAYNYRGITSDGQLASVSLPSNSDDYYVGPNEEYDLYDRLQTIQSIDKNLIVEESSLWTNGVIAFPVKASVGTYYVCATGTKLHSNGFVFVPGAKDIGEVVFSPRTFTLTYQVDGETYRTYELAEGDVITPEAAPTKEGYTFSGWSEIPETMPANDVTVTGTFTAIPEPSSDNTLAISNAETYAGKQVVLPIDMNNVASIKAFQYDLYLPEGITIAKDEDEEELIELTSRAAKSHTIAYSNRPDGAIRMVCTSMSGATFKGNEGTIVNVTLDVAQSMTDGDYDIEIKNIELSDGTPYNPADIKATLTVKTYTPGDVDGTGTVSVNDAVCVINYILGEPAEDFIEPAADLDGNGVITVNDVVILINDYILGGNSQNSLDLAFLEDVTAEDDYLYIEEDNLSNMTAGEEREIEVFMNTSRTDIQGLQCDIYLPDGMEFVPEEDGDEKYYADKGGRAAKSHSVAAQLMADGSVRVVETSTSGAKFKANELAVFYFTVRATANTAYGQGIRLCNMELSYGGAPINPEDRTFDVKVKAGTVSLNSEGYATFSHASDVEVEGAEVYTATRNGNIISCTKEEQSVAAFNGVILKGEPDATVTLYTNNGVEGYTGNELKPTTTAAGVADIETALVLSGNMFKNYTGAAFVADKAYMPYDGNSANAIEMVFDDATAINSIASENNLLDGAVIKTVEDGKLVIKTANGKYSSVGAKMK